MRRYLAVGAALVAVLALALAAVGCGGSSDKKSLSKAEFLKKGNAICRKGNQELDAAGKKIFSSNKKPSKAQMTAFVKGSIIPGVQREVDGIRGLGAPKGDESKVKAIVDAAQAGIDKGKQNPLSLAQQGEGPFKHADDLAKAYGLTVCGSG
jgi:hypothetical protein